MKFSLNTLYRLVFIIIIILLGIYLLGQKEVELAKVTIEINKSGPFIAARFNESERDELIGDISLHTVYANKISEPRGNEMSMPGISVGLFRDKMIIGEWTSAPIQDKGVYELTVGLNQPVKKGDLISIAVYVNDDRGQVIIGKRKDVAWG